MEIWTSILWNLPGQSLINILPQLKKAASVFRCGCRSVIITMSFTHTPPPHTRLESPSPSPPHLRIPVNILTQHQDPEVSKDPGPQSPPAGGGLLQVEATPPPSPTSLRRLSTSVYPPSSPRSGSPASTSPSPPPLPHQNRGEMHENKINAEPRKKYFPARRNTLCPPPRRCMVRQRSTSAPDLYAVPSLARAGISTHNILSLLDISTKHM